MEENRGAKIAREKNVSCVERTHHPYHMRWELSPKKKKGWGGGSVARGGTPKAKAEESKQSGKGIQFRREGDFTGKYSRGVKGLRSVRPRMAGREGREADQS